MNDHEPFDKFELVPDEPKKSQKPRRRRSMDDYADWDDEPQQSSGGSSGIIMIIALIVLLGFAAVGGFLYFIFQSAGDFEGQKKVPRPRKRVSGKKGHIGRFTLSGPDGSKQFPTQRVTVVNVFLQACPDCMPAFRKYRDCGGFGSKTPVVNIGYNKAEKRWLRDYNMDKNVYIDKGGRALVMPQGIRSFTTLVVDGDGKIHLRILPTDKGYVNRVKAKVRELRSS